MKYDFLFGQAPKFIEPNLCFLCRFGSIMYGLSDDTSDEDLYGFCIPPKNIVFPHLDGHIIGFGKQIQRFSQFQQHHIQNKGKVYDINIYNVVDYFNLCMGCNPNMIDSLFCPDEHVLISSPAWELLKKNRDIFLSKHIYFKLKGYAHSQVHKVKIKKPENEKRKALVEQFGYDTKFAGHAIRLLLQCKQILTECTLSFNDNTRNTIILDVRRGKYTQDEFLEMYSSYEGEIDNLVGLSKLRSSNDEQQIKRVLDQILEEYYNNN